MNQKFFFEVSLQCFRNDVSTIGSLKLAKKSTLIDTYATAMARSDSKFDCMLQAKIKTAIY